MRSFYIPLYTPSNSSSAFGSASRSADAPCRTIWPFSMTTAEIGVRKHLAVVAVDDERGDAGRADLADHAPDLGHDQRREPFGGLVEDQQARVGHQRAADGKHLLLAARELLAAMRKPLGQARKGGHHAVEGPGAAAVDARALAHHEVLAHREVREDAAAFGHIADAQARHFLGRPAGHGAAVDLHFARGRTHVAHHAADERGLAHAVAPEQAHRRGGRYAGMHAAQDVAVAVVGVEIADDEHQWSSPR